jgi:hypothetical protein
MDGTHMSALCFSVTFSRSDRTPVILSISIALGVSEDVLGKMPSNALFNTLSIPTI